MRYEIDDSGIGGRYLMANGKFKYCPHTGHKERCAAHCALFTEEVAERKSYVVLHCAPVPLRLELKS